jgi:hypothetical protein
MGDARHTRVTTPMPPELIAAVEEWRRQQPGRPSRSEAIRRLVQIGLRASAAETVPAAAAVPDVSGAAHAAAARTGAVDASAAGTGPAEWPIGSRQAKLGGPDER